MSEESREKKVTAMTVRFNEDAMKSLEEIREFYHGIPLNEVLRRAILHEKFLINQSKSNKTIIIEDNDSKEQRVLIMS